MKTKTLKLLAVMLLAVVFATPALAQQSNWAGPYVGINVGHGSGKGWEDTYYVTSVKGKVGGFEAGYNWRKNNIVFGVAGDMSVSSIKGAETIVDTYISSFEDYTERTTITNTVALDRFSMLRGRLGYVAGPWLMYGTGGIALARVKMGNAYQSSFMYRGSSSSSSGDYQQVKNATGWVFGGGVEYAINRDLSAKVEYLSVEIQDLYSSEATAPLKVVRIGVQYNF